MADMVYFVRENGKDEEGPFSKLVGVYHDPINGNGDPDEDVYAKPLVSIPGGSREPVEFDEAKRRLATTQPAVWAKIQKAFENAQKIRPKKRPKQLTGAKKAVVEGLRSMLKRIEG